MDSDRLAAIRQRADAATPGPWSAADENELIGPQSTPSWYVSQMRPGYEAMAGHVDDRGRTDGWLRDVAQTFSSTHEFDHDAEFIAHTRQDVPDLLAEVDRLTAERDELAEQNRHAVAKLREFRNRLAYFEDGQPRLDPRFIRQPEGPTP